MNDFIDALQSLIDYIYQPLIQVLNDVLNTNIITLTPGIGQVVWFTITLDSLIYYIITFIVYFIIIRLVYRFIKMPFTLFSRLF